MSQAKSKVEWCLRKAEKEGKSHRGLIKTESDYAKAKGYLEKAVHYLRATEYLKESDFSDVSMSTIFYSIYHCLLAIAAKQGYDSRNQECTFALMYHLVEEGKLDFDKETLEKIAKLEPKDEGDTTVRIRERYQYGTDVKINDTTYKKLVELSKEVLEKTRYIIEK